MQAPPLAAMGDAALAPVDLTALYAVGVVASLVCLLVFNRIEPDDSPAPIVGMLAVQALPMSLGAAVANAVFKRSEDRHGGRDEGPVRRLLNQVGAAAAGAALAMAHASETASAYVVALAVAFASLLLFNWAELGDPVGVLLAQTLVLGLPAAIGAAAGRLVL